MSIRLVEWQPLYEILRWMKVSNFEAIFKQAEISSYCRKNLRFPNSPQLKDTLCELEIDEVDRKDTKFLRPFKMGHW